MRTARTSRFWFSLLITRCLLAFCLCSHAVRAQNSAPLNHQVWSTEEGLPAGAIHQVFQSRDGFIWLATEGGAVRFDGVSFTTFNHENEPAFAENEIVGIAEDNVGNLWFGTPAGLIELSHDRFRSFSERDGLSSKEILALATPADGAVLVLTSSGLARFDGSSFSRLGGAALGATSLETCSDGSVWLLADSGISRYTSSGFAIQRVPHGMGEPLTGIATTSSAVVWVRSARGVFELKENGATRQLRAGVELPAGRITALQVRRHGDVEIGTTHGLYTLAPGPGGKPVQVDALRGEAIASLLEDHEGNLWVGTEGSGLHVLRPRVFRSEAAAAGEAVTSVVVASDGSPWFGTKGEGLHAISAGSLQTPVTPASITSPIVLSLAAGHHGDVWAGTPDGLNHIVGKKVEQFTSAAGLPDDFVRSVLVDTRETVWAGTRRGLARIEDGVISSLTTAQGLGSDSIGPLLDVPEKGQTSHIAGLWVGTAVGISHLQGERFQSFSPPSGSVNSIVTALAAGSRSGLWVGFHGNGLSYFEDGKFTHIASNSLPDEVVGIAVDQQRFVWLRGVRAAYRVAEDDLLACKQSGICTPSVAAYNTVDGMPSDTLAGEGSPTLWVTPGELWLATRTGLAVANTASVYLNTDPPPVVIERFRVDDRSAPSESGPVQIQPGHSRYAFEFAALSFTAPSKNRYRYMLEGFDPDWIEAGSTRTASYTNLPPRSYTFRVQAANNDGVWNRVGASLKFRVLPPFYKRWWFYVLILFFVAALAFLIYRLRVVGIEHRFALVLNERSRVAREVHDTLAQDFVSVTLQLDLASALLKAKQYEETATQLQSTRKLVKEGLEEARQSIWNLRANTAVDSLPARLTELVKRYTNSSFRLKLKMGGAYHRVAAAVEDEVFRIVQESLSNVERHARATEASVDLHYEQAALRLKITDNGVGFSPDDAKHLQGHYGLRGMHERAAAINGTFTIQSEPERGTVITLLVSLPEREGAQP